MRGFLVAWIASVVLSLTAVAAPAWAGQRVALVVGNAGYEHAPALATPLIDVADIGMALERLGFAVTRIDDADQGDLRRSLHEFATAAGAAEMALVFYAGHGIAAESRNFLVPVDARLSSHQDIEFEAVPLELVERAVGRASNVRLIILDASRESPFAVSMQRDEATGPVASGLVRIEPSAGTLVVYAAKEDTVAVDGDGRNSIYSEALLRHLEEPGLVVEQMLRKAHDAVLAATGGSQVPSLYGSLSDRNASFGWEPASSEEAPAAPAPIEDGTADDLLTAERLAAERLFWESMKDSEDPSEIRAYLDQYPDGTFAALARARLKRVGGATEPLSPDAGSASEAQASADAGTETPSAPAEQFPTLDPRATEEALGLQRDHRRLVQSGLALLGFDPGPADGVFGRRTRAAIGKWQASEGKAATGYLDVEAAKILARRGLEAPSPSKQREMSTQAAMDTLAMALQTAGEIDDHIGRAGVLTEIADVLVEVGDARRAMRALNLASEAAEKIDSGYRNFTLVRIAAGQAAAGDVQAAFKTAARIEDESIHADAVSKIAIAQAGAGDVEGAFVSLERITDHDSRAEALAGIAEAQARAGDTTGSVQSLRAALAASERIADDWSRAWTLAYVASVQANAGDMGSAAQSFTGASAAAERITDIDFRVVALGHIAQLQAKSGYPAGSAESLERALAITARVADDYSRVNPLVSIAGYQARTGDLRGAAQSIERAVSSTEKLEELVRDSVSSNIDIARWSLAAAQAEAGDVRSALATAQRLSVELFRDGALGDIATAQAEAGDVQGALATVERIAGSAGRASALARVAAAQIGVAAR